VPLTSFAGFQMGALDRMIKRRHSEDCGVQQHWVQVIECATHKDTSQPLFESVRSPAQHDAKETYTGEQKHVIKSGENVVPKHQRGMVHLTRTTAWTSCTFAR
jgi:hypothetical protein